MESDIDRPLYDNAKSRARAYVFLDQGGPVACRNLIWVPASVPDIGV